MVAAAVTLLAATGAPGFAQVRPVFTITQADDPADRVAEYARRNTPVDAVFVVPPLLGRFRLVARRAIVVDFKNFGFTDQAMMSWRARMVDCYGEPEGGGFAAAHAMENRYRRITEDHLLRLRHKYGAGYAVLFADTPCSLPLLYADENHKLVAIAEPVAD